MSPDPLRDGLDDKAGSSLPGAISADKLRIELVRFRTLPGTIGREGRFFSNGSRRFGGFHREKSVRPSSTELLKTPLSDKNSLILR